MPCAFLVVIRVEGPPTTGGLVVRGPVASPGTIARKRGGPPPPRAGWTSPRRLPQLLWTPRRVVAPVPRRAQRAGWQRRHRAQSCTRLQPVVQSRVDRSNLAHPSLALL